MTEDINITRIFDAPIDKVWEAWTNSDIVKKWWGPKDFFAPSIKIDLRAGGKYIFCMHGPKNSEFDKDMYSSGIYKEVTYPTEGKGRIVVTDYFSDKEGNKVDPREYGMGSDMPDEMNAIITFEGIDNSRTKLTLEYIYPGTDKGLKAMRESGMEEGWNQSLDKLDEVLTNL